MNPFLVLLVLLAMLAISEWLASKTFLKHFGTALLVIVLTAVIANLGIIPSASEGSIVYDGIFKYVAPVAIFLLLLEVNLQSLKKAGWPILTFFLIGSLGTFLGAFIGLYFLRGYPELNAFAPQLAGMFTGTYTGGSINFNAIALEYEMQEQGVLYAGSIAIDNIITALWMIITIALPKVLSAKSPNADESIKSSNNTEGENLLDESDKLKIFDLSFIVALGMMSLWASESITSWLKQFGLQVPMILILTTFSLLFAQIKFVHNLKGSRTLGLFGIYLFLSVIGAYCELGAVPALGSMAVFLLSFVIVIIVVHAIVLFGAAFLFRQDWDLVVVASQANIGGQGSAVALAKSLNRQDLFLPAILMGTLGNAIGTYLGFLMVGIVA